VLHPDMTDETDYPTREAASCAPFVSDEASVLPVWQRLAARAAVLGQSVPKLEITGDPELQIIAKGRTVRALYGENGLYIFVLPKGQTSEPNHTPRRQSAAPRFRYTQVLPSRTIVIMVSPWAAECGWAAKTARNRLSSIPPRVGARASGHRGGLPRCWVSGLAQQAAPAVPIDTHHVVIHPKSGNWPSPTVQPIRPTEAISQLPDLGSWSDFMSAKPLVGVIPHRLGRQAARQRIESGLAQIHTEVAAFATIQEERWLEDLLEFRLGLLHQHLTGRIEVLDESVRVEIDLPWILRAVAGPIAARIQQVGTAVLNSA